MAEKIIGILGGGQLGRMFIEEALRYNIRCHILDADKDCPAAVIADHHVVGSLTDPKKIAELADGCDVLTYEIEHIFIETLLELEREGKELIPSPRVLQIIQDKGAQKNFFLQNQIPTSGFFIAENREELLEKASSLTGKKLVLKSSRHGYDGRGVEIISRQDLMNGKSSLAFPVVAEEFISGAKEIAVIVAVDRKQNVSCYPAVEMEFDSHANLVRRLFSPSVLPEKIIQEAEAIAKTCALKFNSPGLFAVEMFVDEMGNILVNEVAPRPHNSGHHTIEACYTSQYEQLLRILLGIPLGSTKLIQPAAMINLLGGKNFSGKYQLANRDQILAMEGVYVHLYGKSESRPMRKLGHITILAASHELLMEKTKRVEQLAEIIPA